MQSFKSYVLCAGLFSAGGMGLWHGVEYYEEEKLKTEPWKASWDQVLKRTKELPQSELSHESLEPPS